MSIDNALLRGAIDWWGHAVGGVPSLALRAGVILAVAVAVALGAEPQIQRRAERPEWEIQFADDLDVGEYARQIDYFKIEIAATAKSGRTEYVREVTRPKPPKHVGQLDDDNRLRIKWRKGTLHAADRKLLARSGINSQDKELWHFFTPDVRATLERLEREYAGRPPNEIRSTRFLVRAKERAAGYEFVVIEQDPPRPAPAKSNSQNSPEPVPSEPVRP